MTRPSSRDKILDALALVVIRDGVGAATLDAVCREAGLSKGGLLYHFPSRESLFAGLHDRLVASIDASLAEVPSDRVGMIEWYLDDPALGDTESALYAAFIASARADASGDIGSIRLAEMFERFFEPLQTLDDPALVAHVQMVSDGMFLRSILGLPLPDATTRAAMVARIVADA
ncbi:MAG: TetR/AcrR family transcriptional regulator [Ilumatobacteraceae bacterium]